MLNIKQEGKVDMPLIELNRIEEREPVEGFKARFVHTEKMTFGFFIVTAGSALPEHSHFHEQVSVIKEGEMELTVGHETFRLKPGQILSIPSNVPHSGRAITDCVIMDVFCPVREDYK